MAAAMSMGTKIPKLCATDSLEAFGSCRLCLVEIEGRRGTPASCTTPAEDGMVVHTQNARLAKLLRKHRDSVLRFLDHDGVDATNNLAEREGRPAVIARVAVHRALSRSGRR